MDGCGREGKWPAPDRCRMLSSRSRTDAAAEAPGCWPLRYESDAVMGAGGGGKSSEYVKGSLLTAGSGGGSGRELDLVFRL